MARLCFSKELGHIKGCRLVILMVKSLSGEMASLLWNLFLDGTSQKVVLR